MLGKVTLYDNVTSIGYAAFYGCSSLASIDIPDSVSYIGYSAFNKCSSLTSISIPIKVTEIDKWTFYNCNSLSDVYYGGTEAEWNRIAIKSGNEPLKNATIHFIGEPRFTVSQTSQKAEITNLDSREHTVAVIIAKYENSILKDVSSEYVIFAAEEKKAYDLNDDCKVFVWNSLSDMYPLNK